MTEKAVRIWFQNRRAKMRKSERMGKAGMSNGPGSVISSRSSTYDGGIGGVGGVGPGPGSGPGSGMTSNHGRPYKPQELSNIDINEKYCFIHCSSLSVGSWQRIRSGFHDDHVLADTLVNLSPFTINSAMENVDLLVILSKKNLEINYFFSAVSNNTKILFRIFYPITSIITCSLLDNNIDKDSNELRVSLAHQPKFSVNFFNGIDQSSNQWSICDDFSEGQQVSSAHSVDGSSIPHVLVGTKPAICFLNDFILEKNQVQPSLPMVDDNNNNNDDNEPVTMPIDEFNINTARSEIGDLWDDSNELKANGLSPLGQFASDTSPNSGDDIDKDTSENPKLSPQINSHGKPTTSNNNDNDNEPNDVNSPPGYNSSSFHYNEMFSAHTPDFFNSSQTPNMNDGATSTEIDPDSKPKPSPYHPLANQENYQDLETNQDFDFPVVEEYSGLPHSNDMSQSSSHVDSFIDYNSNYP